MRRDSAAALAVLAAGALIVAPATALAASPSPQPAHRSSGKFVPRTPTTPQHTEFVVEVNKKGQVIKVDSGRESHDRAFNAITYGNVLQAFIRRPDGTAVSGLYRLTYDYDPTNKLVRRDVALLHAGGVDSNALGAVDQEIQKLAAEQMRRHLDPVATPSPLPDLKAITGHRH
jgi:hypothetical protein